MKTLIPVLLFGLILSSCSPAPPDAAKVRKDIEALEQKAAKDMMNGIMDTTFAQYTDDAIYMPDHEPMIKGKNALKENSRKMMAMGMKFPKVEFTTMDVNVIGSYAYEVGTYAMTIQMPGMPEMTDEGKYLTIYQQAADGSWKIKVETWNTSKPFPMPPSGT